MMRGVSVRDIQGRAPDRSDAPSGLGWHERKGVALPHSLALVMRALCSISRARIKFGADHHDGMIGEGGRARFI